MSDKSIVKASEKAIKTSGKKAPKIKMLTRKDKFRVDGKTTPRLRNWSVFRTFTFVSKIILLDQINSFGSHVIISQYKLCAYTYIVWVAGKEKFFLPPRSMSCFCLFFSVRCRIKVNSLQSVQTKMAADDHVRLSW